jgi:hypothetical protein
MMARIQPELKVKETPMLVRLRTDVQAQLHAYGTFLNPEQPSSVAHIVTELFREAAKSDREFQTYWEQHKETFLKQVDKPSRTAVRRGKTAVTKSAA